jgi:sec-independent protein translocase protein TatC
MFESEQIVGAFHWLNQYRKRIVIIFLVPVLLAIGVYIKTDLVIQIIAKPLKGLPLHFITPIDGFMAKMKLALYGGAVLSLPFLAYLIISMFARRMTKRTRWLTYLVVVPFATISFIGGLVFGYFLVLPGTMKFLLDCGNEFMEPVIMGSNYFSFIAFLLITIGFVFELPLVLVTLSRVGIVSSRFLRSKRKIAIMVILILLAILTPTPDVLTLSLVSAPMIFLYEISIWWIFFLEKAAGRRENESENYFERAHARED